MRALAPAPIVFIFNVGATVLYIIKSKVDVARLNNNTIKLKIVILTEDGLRGTRFQGVFGVCSAPGEAVSPGRGHRGAGRGGKGGGCDPPPSKG